MHGIAPSSPATCALTETTAVDNGLPPRHGRIAQNSPDNTLPSASRACQARWARGLAGGAQAVPRNGRPCGPVSILICVAGAWGLEWGRGHKMAHPGWAPATGMLRAGRRHRQDKEGCHVPPLFAARQGSTLPLSCLRSRAKPASVLAALPVVSCPSLAVI